MLYLLCSSVCLNVIYTDFDKKCHMTHTHTKRNDYCGELAVVYRFFSFFLLGFILLKEQNNCACAAFPGIMSQTKTCYNGKYVKI